MPALPGKSELADRFALHLSNVERSAYDRTNQYLRGDAMGKQRSILCGGIHFGEGPRWHNGGLWLSDFFAHGVKSVSLKGDLRTEFTIDDRPSGLGWLPNGDLVFVSMEKRKLMRRDASGKITQHADLNNVATWYCNDMVVDSAGR